MVWDRRIHCLDQNLFPMSFVVSEWASKQTNKWAQRSARAKRAVRSQRMSEQWERTSERRSKWPTTLRVNFITILPNVHCRPFYYHPHRLHQPTDLKRIIEHPYLRFLSPHYAHLWRAGSFECLLHALQVSSHSRQPFLIRRSRVRASSVHHQYMELRILQPRYLCF